MKSGYCGNELRSEVTRINQTPGSPLLQPTAPKTTIYRERAQPKLIRRYDVDSVSTNSLVSDIESTNSSISNIGSTNSSISAIQYIPNIDELSSIRCRKDLCGCQFSRKIELRVTSTKYRQQRNRIDVEYTNRFWLGGGRC